MNLQIVSYNIQVKFLYLFTRASVENTDYEYFAQDDFRVRKPDIKFVFSGRPTHTVAHDIHIRLENPMPIPLTKGIFQIEGSGIETPIILKVKGKSLASQKRSQQRYLSPPQVPDIQPNTFAETRFVYKPTYVGSAKLIAKFTSKEMDDVDGFRVFEIAAQPEDVLTPEIINETIEKTVVVE